MAKMTFTAKARTSTVRTIIWVVGLVLSLAYVMPFVLVLINSFKPKMEILDNGPGIPSDMIENIFYPMISGRAEGTGLGLTISQHLIHQHHGLIECQSEPGKTRFSLYLPMEAQHAEV